MAKHQSGGLEIIHYEARVAMRVLRRFNWNDGRPACVIVVWFPETRDLREPTPYNAVFSQSDGWRLSRSGPRPKGQRRAVGDTSNGVACQLFAFRVGKVHDCLPSQILHPGLEVGDAHSLGIL